LNEFRCLLASWNEHCASYEHAYSLEVERNKQTIRAYQLLVLQHREALDDIGVHASKCWSLQRELEVMQTETLAQDAAAEWYMLRLASQPVEHCKSERVNETLVRRVAELEEELSGMKHALCSTGELLDAFRSHDRSDE
jgi:alpha-ketoglutarate-dependent taurine dioxygenase